MPPSGHDKPAVLGYVTIAWSNFSGLRREVDQDYKYPSYRIAAQHELKNLNIARDDAMANGLNRGFIETAIGQYELLLKNLDKYGDDVQKTIDVTLAEIERAAQVLHITDEGKVVER